MASFGISGAPDADRIRKPDREPVLGLDPRIAPDGASAKATHVAAGV
jgi:hypothetical protein